LNNLMEDAMPSEIDREVVERLVEGGAQLSRSCRRASIVFSFRFGRAITANRKLKTIY
jgi:hypothetical protein